MANDSPSEGTDVRVTACGDYIVTHGGRHYPVKKEALTCEQLAYLGHLVIMQNLYVANEEEVEGSRIAHIYHNAEDANETCLGRIEKEKQ